MGIPIDSQDWLVSIGQHDPPTQAGPTITASPYQADGEDMDLSASHSHLLILSFFHQWISVCDWFSIGTTKHHLNDKRKPEGHRKVHPDTNDEGS